MRAILAILLAIVILFGGFIALGYQSQAVEDPAVQNGTYASQDAYNFSNQVYDGLGQVFSPAVVWMGIGAIVLLGLGFLVYVAGGR